MGKPATELHGAGLASYNTLTLAEGYKAAGAWPEPIPQE